MPLTSALALARQKRRLALRHSPTAAASILEALGPCPAPELLRLIDHEPLDAVEAEVHLEGIVFDPL
jgi:hypothetical protein